MKVFLKLDLTDYNMVGEDLEVYVDDELFGEISDYEDLNEDENTYYIDNDFSHLVFSRERIERNSIIKIKAKPEELNFFKKEKNMSYQYSALLLITLIRLIRLIRGKTCRIPSMFTWANKFVIAGG